MNDTRNYARKLTFLQVEEAVHRVAFGEPARHVAKDFNVTEGALRYHFRKGLHPVELRRLALGLLHVRQMLDGLTPSERRAVELEVKRLRVDSRK